jgi:hypothetical protein
VYGTDIPIYKFNYKVDYTDDGQYLFTIRVSQKNVSESFEMPIFVLIYFEEGYAIWELIVKGCGITEEKFGFSRKPKSVEFSPWYGVLCEIKK